MKENFSKDSANPTTNRESTLATLGFSPKEKDHYRAVIQNAINQESQARRLEKIINDCKNQLIEIESRFDFRKFAEEVNPYFAYRSTVRGSADRRSDLESFVHDMEPIVDEIMNEARESREIAKSIEAKALERAKLIQQLEDEAAITGESSKDKRDMLLKLKAEIAGVA